jgi:hypothetical protein
MDSKTKTLIYKKALERKLEKVKNRLSIIDRYVADEKSKTMSLAQWMKSNNLDIREFFSPIGYNAIQDKAISHDAENKFIKCARNINYDKRKGHPVILIEETSGIDGMVFNENTQKYYPLPDGYRYEQELANQKPIIYDIEGININEIGDLDISSSSNKYKAYWLKEALGSEYDNIEGEYSRFDNSPLKQEKRERRIAERMQRVRLCGNPF